MFLLIVSNENIHRLVSRAKRILSDLITMQQFSRAFQSAMQFSLSDCCHLYISASLLKKLLTYRRQDMSRAYF